MSAAEEEKEEEPIQAVHGLPMEATVHHKEVHAAEEVEPVEASAHMGEHLPVEAPAQQELMSEAEMAAPLDAMTDKVLPETAQPEELPSAPAVQTEAFHEEEKAGHYESAQEEVHQAEPEQAQALTEEPAAAVAATAAEEPVTETKVLGAHLTV